LTSRLVSPKNVSSLDTETDGILSSRSNGCAKIFRRNSAATSADITVWTEKERLVAMEEEEEWPGEIATRLSS